MQIRLSDIELQPRYLSLVASDACAPDAFRQPDAASSKIKGFPAITTSGLQARSVRGFKSAALGPGWAPAGDDHVCVQSALPRTR